MRAAGFEPLTPFPGAHAAWACRCSSCGRDSKPTYSKIRSGRGCRFCAIRGLDFSVPGVVYLVVHNAYFAVKIGVTTGAAEDRLITHRREGWVGHQQWHVPSGDAAIEIERSVLEWWRNELHAPQALTREQMPRGGWTETASLRWVDLAETASRIDAAVLRLDDQD